MKKFVLFMFCLSLMTGFASGTQFDSEGLVIESNDKKPKPKKKKKEKKAKKVKETKTTQPLGDEEYPDDMDYSDED